MNLKGVVKTVSIGCLILVPLLQCNAKMFNVIMLFTFFRKEKYFFTLLPILSVVELIFMTLEPDYSI